MGKERGRGNERGTRGDIIDRDHVESGPTGRSARVERRANKMKGKERGKLLD